MPGISRFGQEMCNFSVHVGGRKLQEYRSADGYYVECNFSSPVAYRIPADASGGLHSGEVLVVPYEVMFETFPVPWSEYLLIELRIDGTLVTNKRCACTCGRTWSKRGIRDGNIVREFVFTLPAKESREDTGLDADKLPYLGEIRLDCFDGVPLPSHSWYFINANKCYSSSGQFTGESRNLAAATKADVTNVTKGEFSMAVTKEGKAFYYWEEGTWNYEEDVTKGQHFGTVKLKYRPFETLRQLGIVTEDGSGVSSKNIRSSSVDGTVNTIINAPTSNCTVNKCSTVTHDVLKADASVDIKLEPTNNLPKKCKGKRSSRKTLFGNDTENLVPVHGNRMETRSMRRSSKMLTRNMRKSLGIQPLGDIQNVSVVLSQVHHRKQQGKKRVLKVVKAEPKIESDTLVTMVTLPQTAEEAINDSQAKENCEKSKDTTTEGRQKGMKSLTQPGLGVALPDDLAEQQVNTVDIKVEPAVYVDARASDDQTENDDLVGCDDHCQVIHSRASDQVENDDCQVIIAKACADQMENDDCQIIDVPKPLVPLIDLTIE